MNLQELGRIATAGRMIPNAPIEASRSVRIMAPAKAVWDVLISVSKWEQWYPYLRNAQISGDFLSGSQLTYGGLFKHHLRIAKVTDQKLVMLYGTMLGYKGITRWNLRGIDADQTEVSFSESSAGLLLGTLYSNEKLGTHLQQWLCALKSEAERIR